MRAAADGDTLCCEAAEARGAAGAAIAAVLDTILAAAAERLSWAA